VLQPDNLLRSYFTPVVTANLPLSDLLFIVHSRQSSCGEPFSELPTAASFFLFTPPRLSCCAVNRPPVFIPRFRQVEKRSWRVGFGAFSLFASIPVRRFRPQVFLPLPSFFPDTCFSLDGGLCFAAQECCPALVFRPPSLSLKESAVLVFSWIWHVAFFLFCGPTPFSHAVPLFPLVSQFSPPLLRSGRNLTVLFLVQGPFSY